MDSKKFINALETNNIMALNEVPKSELHNHGLLGARYETYNEFAGITLEKCTGKMHSIDDINDWIMKNLDPYFSTSEGLYHVLKNAFAVAKESGVTLLEMSIDVYYHTFCPNGVDEFISITKSAHQNIAPEIDFRPEIGFARAAYPYEPAVEWFDAYLETGYFKSIDIYSRELADSYSKYKPLYEKAKKRGLKLKAHAGEFGTADTVREAVETLELDAVQHGIAAATSPELMRFLADNNIMLNICPTSNFMLSLVESLETHPIRILYDNGVNVSINTDDIAVFHQTVSDEYLNLYNAGVFTAEELNKIRLNGLAV